MLDGATVRCLTCLGSILSVEPSARLSSIDVADSLATEPVSVSPVLSWNVTLSNPGAMCAFGLTTDSSRYSIGCCLPIIVRSGPASPPLPLTLWQRAQGSTALSKNTLAPRRGSPPASANENGASALPPDVQATCCLAQRAFTAGALLFSTTSINSTWAPG